MEGENDPADTGDDKGSLRVSCSDPAESPCPRLYQISQFGTPVYYGTFNFIRRETNIFYLDAKAGKTYKLYLWKGGLHTKAMLSVIYYPTAPATTNTNLETGGIRIKTTKDFANSSAKAIYKRYHYANKDDINHSSGDRGKNSLLC
jgi:hypothetical protein